MEEKEAGVLDVLADGALGALLVEAGLLVPGRLCLGADPPRFATPSDKEARGFALIEALDVASEAVGDTADARTAT
jgi:hypothetical protein